MRVALCAFVFVCLAAASIALPVLGNVDHEEHAADPEYGSLKEQLHALLSKVNADDLEELEDMDETADDVSDLEEQEPTHQEVLSAVDNAALGALPKSAKAKVSAKSTAVLNHDAMFLPPNKESSCQFMPCGLGLTIALCVMALCLVGAAVHMGSADRGDSVFLKADDTPSSMIKGSAAEAIGVFIFVFSGTITCTTLDGNSIGILPIAFAFGLAIMVMVFATGKISGGHLNPAVTVSMMVTGNASLLRGVMYICFQLIGATFGALANAFLTAPGVTKSLAPTMLGGGITATQGCFMEIITTFALVFVVFNTAADARNSSMGVMCGIPIGLTVVLGILASGHLSGGSMNPARSFGPALAAGEWSAHWVYWVGPIIGACTAGLLHKNIFQQEEAAPYKEV